MNVLIVGGAGYLGGAITDLLLKTEYHIQIFDFLLYEEMYRKTVPFVFGDIRDEDKLKPLLDWADVVIWLAALVGDPACGLDEELTQVINIETVRFLKAHFKGRIIFMSTCSVYGAAEGLLDENSPLNPISTYAQSKLEAEKILGQENAIIFRLGTLYGISDQFSRIRFDLVVNTLTMRAFFHGKISVFGGQQFRPLVHVRDVAAIICQSIEKSATGLYNLHSENLTILEISQRVKKYFPGLQIETSEAMFQDNRNYRVLSDKAKKGLQFNPLLTIDDGILELKNLLSEGRIKNSFITRFSNYLYLKPLLDEYASPLGKTIRFNL